MLRPSPFLHIDPTDSIAGDELAKMRRWIYGIEEAPADFMCRDCVFARRSNR